MPIQYTCAHCSKPFIPTPNRGGKPQRFCSFDCRKAFYHPHKQRVRKPPEPAFWRLVDRRGDDECWPWLGATGGACGRYGLFRRTTAHRFALALKLGRPLRDGMHACHTCDNPPCCNPAHLFEGTPKENMADMRAKGRAPDPTKQLGQRKLTDDQVREIRQRLTTGERHRPLADMFGVSRTLISMIATGRVWKHLT